MSGNSDRAGPDVLTQLAATIHERRLAPVDDSYTARLVDAGIEKCAQKFGEEAIETVIAAVAGNRGQTVSESADMLYHLLVVFEAAGIGIHEVFEELQRRQGVSGLVEKANRAGSGGPSPDNG